MQRLTVCGRLGKDLELFETKKNGDKLVYCPFSVATDGLFHKEKNEREVLWLDFVAYGDLATRMSEHLQKGDIIEVVFQAVRKSEDVKGQKISSYKFRVLEVNFLWVRKWHEQSKEAE